MAAQDILNEHADKQGWDDSSMLEIALEYIDNQADDSCFADFVAQQVEDESEMTEEGDSA